MSIPEKLTFRALLENSASKFADRPALGYAGEQTHTYSEVYERATKLMLMLSAFGIKKGDRVALLAQNMPNWGVSYLAVTSMGAVVVPILIDFTEKEIARILEHSGARSIIVSEKQAYKLKTSLPQNLKSAVLMDNLYEISLGNLEMSGQAVRAPKRANQSSKTLPEPPGEFDLAAILYTSGTTGNPKGVMLSHSNILSNAVNTLGIQNVIPEDRLLSVLPLPHTYECTIGFIIPFMSGASVHYIDKPPTPAVLLPAMEAVKPTMMLTVPLIIEKVYRKRVLPKMTSSKAMRMLTKLDPFRKLIHKLAGKKIYKAFGGHLHFFGIGGSKLDAATELFLRDAGFPYAIGYGLTETSPLLAGCGPKITKYQSTGYSLPNQQLRILDPDPRTGEGEIVAKGPNIMLGYYKEPEMTRAVFTEDGWFKTGDLGVIDKDGYLFIRGRIKNIIISSTGENIYPEDIEAEINREHHVLESLVYEIKGKLIAKVHLNYEELDKRYHELRESAGHSYHDIKESAGIMYDQVQQKVKARLGEIQNRVNSRLNRFSKLSFVEEQVEPFEKTPTKKIKRFLYLNKGKGKK